MHNDIIDTIRLDITKSSTNVCIYVRTADTRTLEFFLTNNGNIVDLTGATFAAMYIRKKEVEYYQTVSILGNKVRYTLHDEEVAEEGEASCRIVISFNDYTQITSPVFAMIVEKIPAMSNAITNTPVYTTVQNAGKYSAISDALAEANGYAASCEENSQKAAQMLEDATQTFENIQELLDSTSMIIDIIDGIIPVEESDIDEMWNGTYVVQTENTQTEESDEEEADQEETT